MFSRQLRDGIEVLNLTGTVLVVMSWRLNQPQGHTAAGRVRPIGRKK
jgi:hypothetical protein